MKRFILLCLVICSLILSGCQRDLPLEEMVNNGLQEMDKGQFGEQLEKKEIRMFNADGDLYYDSGLVSENTPRCGTMDGELKKTVEENEIVGAVITDVTQTETNREKISQKAQEVISKNISIVQEIACLLGEHMVETETLLSSIANDYDDKDEENK